MTTTMSIEIVRDGRWWMVHIPEIDGITQARRLSEAEQMAREYIALDQGLPLDQVKVEIANIRMPDEHADFFIELLDGSREIIELKAHARQIEERANDMMREYCHWLVTYEIPVRDIAVLLNISPQRVSQLANVDPDEPNMEALDDVDQDGDDSVSDLLEKLETAIKFRRSGLPATTVVEIGHKAPTRKTAQRAMVDVPIRTSNGKVRTVKTPVQVRWEVHGPGNGRTRTVRR
ncbi:hypothetical protein [Mycobacterium sp. GA-2829]|uniref:hypothetical protein n=1 Tax=Mycobacterium sp. GA-2829 TaxID=1772283 RepID=UPI000A6C0CFD|nr:hypothetical protein [Mycobacterium sp. GA-2829]